MARLKILSQKKLLSSKYFDIEREKLELSSGKQIDYDTVIRRPVVMIAPLTNDNILYFVKQHRHMLDRITVELPAGHLDKGEIALTAAKRELKEEAGLEAKHWEEIAVVHNSASVINSKIHLFLAKDLEELTSAPDEEEEGMELVKISLKQAVDMVISGEIDTLATMYTVLLLDRFTREGKL